MKSTTFYLLSMCVVLTACNDPENDDTAPVDDGCDNADCAIDEFCHQDSCQVIDDRSFRFGFESVGCRDASDNWWYKITVTVGDDWCVTDGYPNNSGAWPEVCDMTIDLDNPDFSIKVLEGYSDGSYDDSILFEFTGLDAVVSEIRSGGSTQQGIFGTHDVRETMVTYTLQPNF